MQWRFVNSKIILEKYSGYAVHLLEGTWDDPVEVRPIIPEGQTIQLQAELLRHGLEFAYDLTIEHRTRERMEGAC